ncbi:DsbA family oxidoreductase [Diaphorobacter aerolatus]|uniref:DsbA family oxidoreductase n=1 Tax=Diaphorobacter aerolatus TaxID=1288495 RepID=A0A7H0GNN8_9BURK|nr:DsbA family oxidoreductase [Diaphorobacter aerolatus]QNP49904.1 DsbA family oxidoreductase [Diaphorobacter aerolatus]
MTAPKTLKIDFVSDVSCPWCAIGLHALEQAAERVKDQVRLDMHFQPFELNADMVPEGEDVIEHLQRKYGAPAEQMRQNQRAITDRGADLGFTFNMDKRRRVYNTFDAHRLLHWIDEQGSSEQQRALKHALFSAYFTEGENPSDHAVLLRIVREQGLDEARAKEILESDEYAREVREREAFYHQHGINSVPAVIINDRHLIQGGQPVEVFEQALRKLAGQV